MNILLDTHYVLWVLMDDTLLSKQDKELILNQDNRIIVSTISLLEISIKYNIGRLSLNNIEPAQIPQLLDNYGYEISNLTPATAATFYQLPSDIHKDPFDRLLIWESIQLNYSLLTRDSKVKTYQQYGLVLAK